MRAPDLVLPGVGVAGFEPTASSSRTAGMAVDKGYFSTSRVTGGRSGAVLGGLVAVSRSCTAAVARRSGLVAYRRHGPGAGPGFAPDEYVRLGGAPTPN
jgi:hypothetical protein